MPKSILISRGLSPEALALIPKDLTVDLNGHQHPLSRQDLLARLRGKQGLICQITDTIDDDVLATPGLLVVANVAVGNGKVGDDGKRIALDVKAGDKILFGKYSGSEVKIEDDEYLILREEDVLAILD